MFKNAIYFRFILYGWCYYAKLFGILFFKYMAIFPTFVTAVYISKSEHLVYRLLFQSISQSCSQPWILIQAFTTNYVLLRVLIQSDIFDQLAGKSGMLWMCKCADCFILIHYHLLWRQNHSSQYIFCKHCFDLCKIMNIRYL